MKLSTNFLKDYLDIDINSKETVHELAEDMTKVGNEYDSEGMLIEATNLVIGEVLECEMHPDSDHLHVCKVNTGKEISQIVCGAPNVRKGLKVIVALPGAKLPGGEIKKSVIRGQESNGMLCSIAELGIESKFLKEEDKAGIHELDNEAPVGGDPIEYMHMKDGVIDFELTANRGDLLSILGMAYEVGAIYDKKVKPIDLTHKDNGKLDFKLNIATDNCTLFLAKKVENVKIHESTPEMKEKLMASGIRPINNVVDISNYVMLETGQPLHFYDADTLKGKLEVRMAKDNEKLTTLDNIERTLKSDDIVISDGERAIGLAGVMGGLDTEITENTKNIIIESAIFDAVKIRKTSKEVLRSEASSRFEKGLDPNRTYMAIERSCNLLEKYADAKIVGGLAKFDKSDLSDSKIDITFDKINAILGINVPEDAVIDVFRRLGFKSEVEGKIVHVSVPKRRVDISIKEDLIEEVGRIYGVDNIVGKLPELPLKQGSYNKTLRQIRNKMIDLGLNETLSYILVNTKESTQYAVMPEGYENAKLLDPMTEERNTLRYSMIPSLVKIYEYNKDRNQKDVCLFEIGKGFYKKGEEYGETLKLCALMTGEYYQGIKTRKQVDFYTIKGVVEEILDYIGYANRYSFVVKNELPKEFHPYQTAEISVNNDIVGIVGKLHPINFKEAVYAFEIDLDKLLDKKIGKMKYKEVSKFPSVKKDIAIIVNKDITSQEIAMAIKKAAGRLLLSSNVFDVYTGAGIEDNKKSIAYSLEFGTNERTLTDEEISGLMEKIVAALEKEFGAELRK